MFVRIIRNLAFQDIGYLFIWLNILYVGIQILWGLLLHFQASSFVLGIGVGTFCKFSWSWVKQNEVVALLQTATECVSFLKQTNRTPSKVITKTDDSIESIDQFIQTISQEPTKELDLQHMAETLTKAVSEDPKLQDLSDNLNKTMKGELSLADLVRNASLMIEDELSLADLVRNASSMIEDEEEKADFDESMKTMLHNIA